MPLKNFSIRPKCEVLGGIGSGKRLRRGNEETEGRSIVIQLFRSRRKVPNNTHEASEQ